MFALKEVIHPDKHARASFIFEGEVLKRLDHPALPRVYQVFERDQLKRVYLLMEYIEGRNLEALYKEQPNQCFTLSLVLTLLAPIVDAVSYLHRQNPPIVHRDIKPANMIVPVKANETVLVDFGSAKEYVAGEATTFLTHRSPGYAAPEQYGSGTTPRTDIYGLGATLYTLLAGNVPTDAISRITRSRSNGSDPLKPVNLLVPGVPGYVSQAIERAMSLDAHDRFSTVDQFWEAINTSPGEQERAPARGAPTPNSTTDMPQRSIERAPARGAPTPNSATGAHEAIPRLSGDLQLPTDMPQIPVKPLLPDIDTTDAPSPVGELPTKPSTLPIFARSESRDIPPAPASPQRLRVERRQSIFSRKWIILVVLAIVIGLSVVAGVGFIVFHHPVATSPISSPTVESSTSTSASTSGAATYPMLAATYTGTIYDVSTNVKMNITLIDIRQNQGKISGYLIVASNLQESGPFSGTIDTTKQLKFTVRGTGGQPMLVFEGTVQSVTSLSGDYYHCGHSQGEQCTRGASGYGIWNVMQAQ